MFSQVPNGNDVVVEISKEKIVVNGKSFFLHKVRKGENLYRISKAYNVTQRDIIIANPEAISGNIKDGQTLRIPLETSPNNNVPQIQSDNFIYHITEDKQTIFFITQKYKITQEELFKYNPELQYSPLQVGQVVKIPKTPNAPVGADKFRPIVKYIEHKVERKETKYSISQLYSISVDELIATNPILNTEDLKKGQILQIPVKSETEVIALPIINKPDTVKPITEAPKETMPCDSYKTFSETINVSILLPVFLEGNETLAMLDSINDEKRNYETNEVYQLTANLLEFYQGALLALDSLKKAGMSVTLHIYDTGKDNQKINSILAKPELAKMNLIIGPLTYNTETLDKVAQFALKNQIKMVSPVSSNIKILKNNPYVFQINANEAFNIDTELRYISSTYANKNIILVNSNKYQDKDTFELYKNKLSAYFPNQFKVFNYNDNPKQISLLLQNNVDNLVIIPSEQEAIVKTILNHLNYLPKSHSVKVFGLPGWAIFRGVEQEFLHNLEFQYATSFYVDFKAASTRNFLNKYKLFYKTAPSYHTKDNSPQFFAKDGYNFAFLGYDVTFYFLNSMGRMGKNFENCFGQQKIDLLHTNIIFERLDNQSGYLNKGVNILKYTKDYTIERVN
jgi:LysM repeat protein